MKIEWRKSSRSGGGDGGGGGDCVELADLSSAIGIRDSKAPEQGHLRVARAELAGLLCKIKSGKLDL
jgi:Domain of unknown function (DUF397)